LQAVPERGFSIVTRDPILALVSQSRLGVTYQDGGLAALPMSIGSYTKLKTTRSNTLVQGSLLVKTSGTARIRRAEVKSAGTKLLFNLEPDRLQRLVPLFA
jgi:hypothetical protein